MCLRDPDRRYPSHHRGESRECQPSFAGTPSPPRKFEPPVKAPLPFETTRKILGEAQATQEAIRGCWGVTFEASERAWGL